MIERFTQAMSLLPMSQPEVDWLHVYRDFIRESFDDDEAVDRIIAGTGEYAEAFLDCIEHDNPALFTEIQQYYWMMSEMQAGESAAYNGGPCPDDASTPFRTSYGKTYEFLETVSGRHYDPPASD